MTKGIRCLLFLCSFTGFVRANSTTDFSVAGKEPNVTNRPHLMLKTSLNPIVFAFAPTNNAGLGCEFAFAKQWTLGIMANAIYSSPFQNSLDRSTFWAQGQNGYSFSSEFRWYIPSTNWFLGLNGTYAYTQKQRDLYYSYGQSAGGWGGTSYIKDVTVQFNKQSIHLFAGYQPGIHSSRFYIDVYAGAGVCFQNADYGDLSKTELYLISAHNEIRSDEQVGESLLPAVYFGVNIGFAAVR